MSATMKLVDRGRPRRLTGQEIQELTQRRVTARNAWIEEERRRRAEEQAAWRRSGARRRRFWTGVLCLGVLGWLGASAWMMSTEGLVAIGYVSALTLTGTALFFAHRLGRG
jgi:hypothetical protein